MTKDDVQMFLSGQECYRFLNRRIETILFCLSYHIIKRFDSL